MNYVDIEKNEEWMLNHTLVIFVLCLIIKTYFALNVLKLIINIKKNIILRSFVILKISRDKYVFLVYGSAKGRSVKLGMQYYL